MAITLLGPLYVLEGDTAFYSINQAFADLASGASFQFEISAGLAGTGAGGTDFYTWTADSFTSVTPGVSFSVTVSPSGVATVIVTNTLLSAIARGSELVRFGLVTLKDPEIDTDILSVFINPATSTVPIVNSGVSTEISSVIRNDISALLWMDLAGDTSSYAGISGTETTPITVSTGSANNKVFLTDAIAYATLNTEGGDDDVQIVVASPEDRIADPNNNLLTYVQFGYGAYKAEIHTGAGRDRVNVQAVYNPLDGGNTGFPGNVLPQDPPAYDKPDYYDSLVDVGDDNDFVYAFLPYQSQFFGGNGVDSIFFYGKFSDWTYEIVDIGSNGLDFTISNDALDYAVWSASGLNGNAVGNSVKGFELIQFNDLTLDTREGLLLAGPGAPVAENSSATCAIKLDGDGLIAGKSVVISLTLASGTANIFSDLAALTSSSLTQASGIILTNIVVDAASGQISCVATANRNFNRSETIATLLLPINNDVIVEAFEGFSVSLGSFAGSQTPVAIQITDNDAPVVRISGPATVVEGNTATPYTVSLGSGVGLGAGRSVTFTLDASSGSAIEGVDFTALAAAGISGVGAITLSTSGPDANGIVTVIATNGGADLAAGSALATFGVATTTDLFTEASEDYTVTLAGGAGVTVEGSSTLTTTITDNDAPVVRISGPATVVEGNTATPYTVSLGSGVGLGAGRSVTFTLDASSGSAIEGVDFTALAAAGISGVGAITLSTSGPDANGIVTVIATNGGADLAAGSALATFGVATTTDLFTEASEDYTVTLAGGAGVTVEGSSTLTTTITDNDAPVVRISGPATVVEGNTATPYTVSLGSGVGLGAGRSVTFTLDASSGSAIKGVDFTALAAAGISGVGAITLSTSGPDANGIVTVIATNGGADLAAGSALATFGVATTTDLSLEAPETFKFVLEAEPGVGTVQGTSEVNTTIVDSYKSFDRVINYGRSVGNATIEPGTLVDVPLTAEEGFAQDSLSYPYDAPDELVGGFDFGLYYKYTKKETLNPNGSIQSVTYEFNRDLLGLKVPRYSYVPYLPDQGAGDRLRAIGYPKLSSGTYINALELSTIRLGAGDDKFELEGDGIAQSLSADVNKEASQGYIFQSTIDAGSGDDYIRALMPFQSVFIGGDSTLYHDGKYDVGGAGAAVILSPALTLEELGLGDVIELKGSRYDWDVEFKDGADDDTSVSLASILNGSGDYVVTSNNNQLSGFEVIRFGDLYFNLVLARQQDSSAIFGQPDYWLIGEEKEAPELNSDIDQGSGLWEGFRFNRTKLKAIVGTAIDLVDVFTGDADDTPYLVGALRFASLNTEDGDDVAFIGSSDQALVDLGAGQDQLEVEALFSRSSARGGAGDDSLIFDAVQNGTLDAGDGNDVVEISTKILSSVVGGGNGFDALILPGSFASYGLVSSVTRGVFSDTQGNVYNGFEQLKFSDISLDVLQPLLLSAPVAPVSEGELATFVITLSGSGLLAGESVSFALQISNGSAANPANVSTDLAALLAQFLKAAPNIILNNVTVDQDSGTIRAVASALTNVAADTSIATLAIPVSADLLSEPDETFAVTLTDFVQATTSTSTIANVDPVTIRLRDVNPLSGAVAEGAAARYAVSLDQAPLAAGRSVSFSLSSDSGTATEGQDFTALSVAALDDAVGLSRSGVSVDAVTGAVTIILANNSGVSIAAGSDLITFDLPISTDASVELPESFSVTLVSTTANVSNAVVTTTIADLVPSPVLALVGSARVSEGQDARYSVNLAGGGLLPTQSVTFTLRTAETATGADADQDVDFPILPAQLTPANGVTFEEISTSIDGLLTISATNSDAVPFAVGRQLFSFTVPTAADVQVETDETFSVVLSQSGVPQVVTTTIVEDEVAPVIRLEGVTSVSEGTIARYAVYLDGVGLTAGQSVRLSLDSSPGTAAEVIDFLALAKDDLLGSSGVTLGEQVVDPVTGSIGVTATNSSGDFLAAGAQLLTFEIDVLTDSVLDADEAFSVLLGSSTASVSVSSLATTIANQLPGAGAGGSTSASAEPTPLPGGGLFITASAAKTGSQPLVGTAFDDVLTGGFGRDELDGGFGIDNLTGGPGSDLFKLRFGDRDADRILDFSPGEDKIEIRGVSRGSRLGRALKSKPSSRNILKTVDNRKQAAASKSLYAYDSSTGAFYYNANGAVGGFGSGGGLVAELSPGLDLGGRDLTFDFL